MSLASNGTWSPLTVAELRIGLVALWKTLYGDNADTDPNTPDGLLISLLANQLGLAFDVDTALWNNSFFRSAPGASLDRILDLFRRERDLAGSSTGSAVFYGTPGTAVVAGTVVVTDDAAANRFATDALDNVGAASNSLTWVVRIMLPIAVGDSYIVQIDANPALATVAAPGDTPLFVAQAMRDDINGQGFALASLAGTDASGSALLVVDIVGVPGNVATTFTGAALLDDVEAVRVDVTATEPGLLLASAGTLQQLPSPIAGILGVSNDVDAVPGSDAQNDDAFRASHLDNLHANTARIDGGMKAAVESIEGIIEAGVTSNRLVAPNDAQGRPLHSTEVVFLAVDGVDVDQEVADAIAKQIPAGIQPFGLASMGLGTTIDGEIIGVLATPVEKLYLHLQLTLTAGESFPTSGDVAGDVAAATAAYFDSGQLSTSEGVVIDPNGKLITGKDMLRTAVPTPVNLVINSGATTIGVLTDVTALPTDSPTFGATDQPADERQIVLADASRITVVIV